MTKRVLLVGLEYTGNPIENTLIETRGLCRSEISQTHAAAALYDYDVIIIYPKSYSHFIFGEPTEFSDSANELWDLKRQNNSYDLDSVFDAFDRSNELENAVMQGTRVIWVMTPDKPTRFFGWRSLYKGYLHSGVDTLIKKSTLHSKNSHKLFINSDSTLFSGYYEQVRLDGWKLCWNTFDDNIVSLATTPEGYSLGNEILFGSYRGWIVTPPTSQESVNILVHTVASLSTSESKSNRYHGIFLTHTSDDKPFTRKLRKALQEKGVENVWIDEAEIMVGDSLLQKIQSGIKQSEYFGIVLSPRSIQSSWVQNELDQAMNFEIRNHSVKVLPLLYEQCELPGFLTGKLYADFTTEDLFEESLGKLLRRLQVRN